MLEGLIYFLFNNLADLILVVYGECENCSFLEKQAVAHVYLNRLESDYKFRSVEEDFKGYTREMKITNKLEREAFKESVKASLRAVYDHFVNLKDPTNGAIFFALKEKYGNIDMSKIFGVNVEPVELPNNFKHMFFRIK